jgi:hypothetical protein
MNKQKSHATYYPDAQKLQFYSSLALDEAVKCLELIPPEYNLKIITTHTDDCRFEVRYGNRRVADAALGHGRLRRWEGTLTRVDCDVQILSSKPHPKAQSKPLNNYVFFAFLLVLIGTVAGLPIIFSLSPVMGIILVVAGGIFSVELVRPRYRMTFSPTDRLFKALEEAFAAAGDIADTPDLLSEQADYVTYLADESPHRLRQGAE